MNSKELSNLKELFFLGTKENDNEIIKDCIIKIDQILNDLKKVETNCFLSGENDELDSYIEIHAGAGGTESQDWAEMLRRMYMRWFDKKNLNTKLLVNIKVKKQELSHPR